MSIFTTIVYFAIVDKSLTYIPWLILTLVLILTGIICITFLHWVSAININRPYYELCSKGTIFKVTLFANKSDNIIHSDALSNNFVVVEECLVQVTKNRNFYKEISTGKLIPVIDINLHTGEASGPSKTNCAVFALRFVDYDFFSGLPYTIRSDLSNVSIYNVSKYYEERKGAYKEFNSILEYFDNLFEKRKVYCEMSSRTSIIEKVFSKL